MSGVKSVTVGDFKWDNIEKARNFYEEWWGLNKEKEKGFADPGVDYKTTTKAKRSEQLGGIEVNLELIRTYQARNICRRCWAWRVLGFCIYEFNKVFVRKTFWRKKWEREEIVKHNVPAVKRTMNWTEYRNGLKKIYKAYRKGMFRSRWTLHKLINQLIDKCSKNEVVVYETVCEERWIFRGWEQVLVEFELTCPLKILFGSADFLVLDERDEWDFEPPKPRKRRWGVGCWDDREENNEFIEVVDHFVDQCTWDDEQRELEEEDRLDNSETIEETETEEQSEKQKDQYVCDNCDLKHSCEYAFDPYCRFGCLADK